MSIRVSALGVALVTACCVACGIPGAAQSSSNGKAVLSSSAGGNQPSGEGSSSSNSKASATAPDPPAGDVRQDSKAPAAGSGAIRS